MHDSSGADPGVARPAARTGWDAAEVCLAAAAFAVLCVLVLRAAPYLPEPDDYAYRASIVAMTGELGNGAIAIQADVTDRDSIVAAAERVKAELGGADILVNNAGVMLLAPFTDQRAASTARWSRSTCSAP